MLPKTKEPPMPESAERLEPRVAKLESDVAHIMSNGEDIKIELRELRRSTDAKFDLLNGKLDVTNRELTHLSRELTQRVGELRVWGLGVIGGGVLTIVAHALHWI